MTAQPKGILGLIKKSVSGWMDKDPFRQSAAVAYYALFSMPGLLVIVIYIAGLFFGSDNVSDKVFKEIQDMLGPNAARNLNQIIQKSESSGEGTWARIIGIITLIFGSIGVFEQLQKSLNLIWSVKIEAKSGFWNLVKDKLFSFSLVIILGFLLLISLVISSLLNILTKWITGILSDKFEIIARILDFAISFGMITLLFAIMFKVLPNVKTKWKDVWIGAIVTSFLFTAGKIILSYYFQKFSPESAYGAAGSLVLVLLWVSYSSMIVFMGAEITKDYSLMKGDEIIPDKNASSIDGKDQTKSL